MAVYSVSQIVSYLRDILARDLLLQDMWVRGEVANLSRPGSGHSYFSLRDGSTSLRCVMFRTALGVGADLLSDGSAVVAHGRVAVYEVRGDLQFVVDVVQPEGLGELQMRLEQLKLKLQNEGLFGSSRKRALPEFPRRVGVVTSPSGAVWPDIQTVVRRRYPLVELVLAPTPVQGDGAVEGIADALSALDRVSDLDVVILARGGGSLEDLWPFNEEAVARAIFASRAPVVSGVGHETDTTVADMVADHRAPTPSAAAEMAVPDRTELSSALLASRQAMSISVSNQVGSSHNAVAGLLARLGRVRPDLDGMRLRVDELLGSVAKHLRRDVALRSERTGSLSRRLESLSPRDTLRRGYAIVQSQADAPDVVSDSAQVSVGATVDVTLARGGFGAEVIATQDADDAPFVGAKDQAPSRES